MELYYKVIQIERTEGGTVITHQKEYKASEPLFARRAAITEAEKLREAIEANGSDKQGNDGLLLLR